MGRQRGSVIIIVLWTSILLTVLVTVMAGKVQLSARTAFHNQQAVKDLKLEKFWSELDAQGQALGKAVKPKAK